jgi:hypothetical protein
MGQRPGHVDHQLAGRPASPPRQEPVERHLPHVGVWLVRRRHPLPVRQRIRQPRLDQVLGAGLVTAQRSSKPKQGRPTRRDVSLEVHTPSSVSHEPVRCHRRSTLPLKTPQVLRLLSHRANEYEAQSACCGSPRGSELSRGRSARM